MTHRMFRPALAPVLALVLAGCATYRAMPLSERPNLASNIADLDRTIPASAGVPAQTMPVDQPLTIDQIGILAILNDPDLASERGQLDNARASLLSATILPNPQVSLGFAALLGGPGASTPAYTASLSQDIMSLVTYRARSAAAHDEFKSFNASLLWQEWQIAQKARLLALTVYGDEQTIRYSTNELSLLSNELDGVQQQTATGNLDLTAEAPLTAAVASAQSALATAELAQLDDWQSLNALLGLEPNTRFAIAEPTVAPPPADVSGLLASLPERRPDLIGLQLGYGSAEASLRAAILMQLPSLMFGPTYNQDTSNVKSLGPTATFDLPIFNRNQGGIAAAKATREQLYAEYQAQLDSAESNVRALQKRIAVLQKDYQDAASAVSGASSVANNAGQAYGQGSIDQRSLVDYQTTVLQRQLDAINFKTQLQSDEVTLGAELGVGLPKTLLAEHPIPPAPNTTHHDQVTPQ
ncbi:MAG: TolC family protein [Rhodospirillales bacterium]|nr:TolC family protein [Rhodospirillales bacterium]